VEVRQQVSLLSQRLAAVDAEVEARVAQGIAEAKRQLRDTDEERLRDFYRQLAPDLFPVDVHLDQSGTDACDAQEMICVSMSRRRLFLSRNHKFYGYMTPSCSARVIREPTCVESSQTDYALKGIVEPRSPEADADVPDLSWQDYVCLQTGKGPQGIYQFANCVKP